MRYEKIHRPCAAEVPIAPNSRGGSQNKKKQPDFKEKSPLKKTKLYSTSQIYTCGQNVFKMYF